MKNFISNKLIGSFLFFLFCAIIMALTVKGIAGNPNSSDLVKQEWSGAGPLEPSVEGGRFALTYSLVENKSLEFSKDVAALATPDLGYRGGKYVSLFAPGVSILSIPGYLIGKILGISQVGTFATIAFFALLNVYLLRKIAIQMGAHPEAASISSVAFIFASPAFAYATTLYQHHISTFLILLSVYLLARFNSFKSIFAVWMIYGIAFMVDYPNLIMMLPVIFFSLSKTFTLYRKNYTFNFKFSLVRVIAILGIVLPLTFALWYNQRANGSPLRLSGTLDRVMSFEENGNPLLGSELVKQTNEGKQFIPVNTSFFSAFKTRNMINGLYVHFISIDRGMIVFTPVMLFGVLGVIYSFKKWNSAASFLIFILAFNILLYSMWDDPQGGWAFGSRYLIPTYAVLSVFIAKFLSQHRRNYFILVFFFAVLSYSISVNTLGALTPTTNPPQNEAIGLERIYGQEQKFTYLRNVDFLDNNDSKSFVFQAFASKNISAWNYYMDITIFIIIVTGFYLCYFAYNPFKKLSSKNIFKSERIYFDKSISFSYRWAKSIKAFYGKNIKLTILLILFLLSIVNFIYYYNNGLGLAYNDARSHLDIGRRVVESIKPGFAQLGSVWLPLPHLLIAVTVWNDFMWHSGLSGAIQSMASYAITGLLIYQILKKLDVNLFGRIMGVVVWSLNLNVLYMQSTAMTELPLIALMLAGSYELILWHQNDKIFNLIKSAFWIMLSTLIRYDGWFLFIFAVFLVFIRSLKRHGYKAAEGATVLFATLGGFGIFIWFLWNQLIFKDFLYFAFGPYSASAQQKIIEQAGYLSTKGNLLNSIQSYTYSVIYNSDVVVFSLSLIGMILLWKDRKIEKPVRAACIILLSPFIFNVLALFMGHSVLYVQGLNGNSWFNVRYGLMMIPAIAIFTGFLLGKIQTQRYILVGLMVFVSLFGYINREIVTLDDARLGLGGKNVAEVSGYLNRHALNNDGFVLLSAAKHDAIIFSSGLPMKRIIHEGTGEYWELAIAHPDKWARWIIFRTQDPDDFLSRLLRKNKAFKEKYKLVRKYPFADVYEIKPQYVSGLQTEPNLALNK